MVANRLQSVQIELPETGPVRFVQQWMWSFSQLSSHAREPTASTPTCALQLITCAYYACQIFLASKEYLTSQLPRAHAERPHGRQCESHESRRLEMRHVLSQAPTAPGMVGGEGEALFAERFGLRSGAKWLTLVIKRI